MLYLNKGGFIMEHKDLASLIISKLIKIILVLIVLLFASNALWIWYINQYDFTTEYVEQEITDVDTSSINQTGVGN
jgi:hypothetical protein